MKAILKIIVQVVHVVSFCGVLLVGALGVIYEIIGHVKFEQMLSAIGITKGFERVWIVSVIFLSLLIITYVIKKKVFAN